MPNTTVPALSGAMPAWSPIMSDVARSILNTVTSRLNGIRADIDSELAEHRRCRRDIEALIERLISGLDELDGDEDLEGQEDANGYPTLDLDLEPGHDDEPSIGWTTSEAQNGVRHQAGYDLEAEHDGREPTAIETRGGGFFASGPDDAEDGGDPEPEEQDGWLSDYTAESCGGILLSYKRGQLVRAQAYARDGRAAQ
jgi:hypothetical protein